MLASIKYFESTISTLQVETFSSNISETVSVTLADYGCDYTALIQYRELICKIEKEVATNYVKAICEKKISFRNYEDRKSAAELILDDTEKVGILIIFYGYIKGTRIRTKLNYLLIWHRKPGI